MWLKFVRPMVRRTKSLRTVDLSVRAGSFCRRGSSRLKHLEIIMNFAEKARSWLWRQFVQVCQDLAYSAAIFAGLWIVGVLIRRGASSPPPSTPASTPSSTPPCSSAATPRQSRHRTPRQSSWIEHGDEGDDSWEIGNAQWEMMPRRRSPDAC